MKGAFAQDFTPPLDIPLVLSGTFGELRSSHFHAGIDIKTQGRTGLEVKSIADGYVSRIKVSTRGYGKALYISHPSGHTSVYAHLKSFSPEIEAYVKKMQYARESFEIELFPDSKRLPVKQGGLIAFSGNTGGSFGPHLHFEIRNTQSEVPVNPLDFGFKVQDTSPPVIWAWYFYALDNRGQVIEQIGKFEPSAKEQIIRLKLPAENLGVGAVCFDRQDGANNLNGNYALDLYVNGKRHFGYAMDAISFSETRYLNSFIDYPEKNCCKTRVQRLYKLPNNPLNILENEGSGLIPIDSFTKLNLELVARDKAGNAHKTKLNLQVIPAKAERNAKGVLFKWDEINNYVTDSLKVYMPAKALYQDEYLSFSKTETQDLGPLYHVHDLSVPVHKRYRLVLRPYDTLKSYADKAYIVSLDRDGDDVFEGGEWEGDFMSLGTRSLGTYAFRVDSIPPTVSFPYLKEGSNYSGTRISILMDDKESGIEEYRVEVNGKFILFEYEPKKNLLFYEIDENLKAGNNTLVVKVMDKLGNTTRLSRSFNYVKP